MKNSVNESPIASTSAEAPMATSDARRPAASTAAMIFLAPVAFAGFFEICRVVIGWIVRCVAWVWHSDPKILGPLFHESLGLTFGHLWMFACLVSFDAILGDKRGRWVYWLTFILLLWTTAGAVTYRSTIEVSASGERLIATVICAALLIVATWFVTSSENRRHYRR